MVIQMVKINGSQQTKQHKQTNKQKTYMSMEKEPAWGLGSGKEIKEGRQWLKLNRIYYLYANCQRTNLIKAIESFSLCWTTPTFLSYILFGHDIYIL